MAKRSSQSKSLRALLIFTFLFVLFISTAFFTIYVGIKGGEIEKRILKPAKESWNNFLKNLTAPSPTPAPLQLYISPTPTPTPTLIPKTQQPPPQYSYPTPVPGRPGSKEWEEEFWRTWDERSKWIEQKNKEVEEAQKRFCEQNPTLCNR